MKSNVYEHGYHVAKGLLDYWKVNHLLPQIHGLFQIQLERYGETISEELHSDMRALFLINQETYLETARAASRLASVQSLLCETVIGLSLSSGCMDFYQPTVPVSPVVHIMSDELKIPDGYYGLAPHQDWTSTQGSLDTVTVWIPLHDVSKDNFPLEVIPGSHLRGVWPGKRNGSYYEIDKSEYKDSDFVPLEVKQGDVVIMSGFTVHRTGMKDSKGLRIAASTRFDNSAEPSFIKRNYPCMYSRTLKQEWQDDKLPGPEEMKEIYG